MEPLDRESARNLFDHYRSRREGIRNKPEMASVCLICGSVHIIPKEGDSHKLVCRDCGFAFFRYECSACGKTVDGRDPLNPACAECGLRVCTCGSCECPPGENH
jgi:DNA-directed RNA polymerase subunit RPC12/RpoP